MKGTLVVLFCIASIADAHLCLLSPLQRGSMQNINTPGQCSAASGGRPGAARRTRACSASELSSWAVRTIVVVASLLFPPAAAKDCALLTGPCGQRRAENPTVTLR